MTFLRTLFLFAIICAAHCSAFAQYPDTIKLGELRIWLKANGYNGSHNNLGYNEARRQMYSFTDEVNGQITCVYTDFIQDAEYTTFLDPINAEHLVPQSFFGSQEPMKSDLHVLRPSHIDANSARSNFKLGEVNDLEATWHGKDAGGDYYSSNNEPSPSEDFSEGTSFLFEPQEDRKGDIARQVFYFYTVYPTAAGNITAVADLNELYDWHINDPVDALEIRRNDRIEIVQGNRNPYIDYSSLVYDAWFWEENNCSLFESSPVGLTKSFQPVPFPDGDIDRVQVKWYKALPQVKYDASDDAICDIDFWPIRDLADNTPILDGDTNHIPQRTKPGLDFFKWPIKFDRSDVQPLVRYGWRVRCGCQETPGTLSPWSEHKVFNTPDFDLGTGIFTPYNGGGEKSNFADSEIHVKFYPNPAQDYIEFTPWSNCRGNWEIINMLGKAILEGDFEATNQNRIDISSLATGLYYFRYSGLETSSILIKE